MTLKYPRYYSVPRPHPLYFHQGLYNSPVPELGTNRLSVK